MDAINMTLDDLLAMCDIDVRIKVYDGDDILYEGYAKYVDIPDTLLGRWVSAMGFHGDGTLVVETEERY